MIETCHHGEQIQIYTDFNVISLIFVSLIHSMIINRVITTDNQLMCLLFQIQINILSKCYGDIENLWQFEKKKKKNNNIM